MRASCAPGSGNAGRVRSGSPDVWSEVLMVQASPRQGGTRYGRGSFHGCAGTTEAVRPTVVSHRVVQQPPVLLSRYEPRSVCHGGQDDVGIIDVGGARLKAHVTALHCPFVFLLEQDGADKPGDRALVGKAEHPLSLDSGWSTRVRPSCGSCLCSWSARWQPHEAARCEGSADHESGVLGRGGQVPSGLLPPSSASGRTLRQ